MLLKILFINFIEKSLMLSMNDQIYYKFQRKKLFNNIFKAIEDLTKIN